MLIRLLNEAALFCSGVVSTVYLDVICICVCLWHAEHHITITQVVRTVRRKRGRFMRYCTTVPIQKYCCCLAACQVVYKIALSQAAPDVILADAPGLSIPLPGCDR